MTKVTAIRGDLDLDEAEEVARKLREKKVKAAGKSRFAVRTLSQFRKPTIPKLIHGLVDHGQIVLVYGGWGSGKSLFCVDWAGCTVYSDDWRGRKVEGGAVVYLAGEASASIEARIQAWLLRRGKRTVSASEPPSG
jgi:RecA-family ATPase